MSKLSIVTLTYNGLAVLKPCIESVLKHCKDIDFEWIIRENGSKDGSLDYLKSLNSDKSIIVLACDNDGNFSKMNNECLEHVSGEYILFLNNDTEATCDFITPMLKVLENDQTVGSVGANLFYTNGQLQHGGIVFDENGLAYNLNNQLIRSFYDINDVIGVDRRYQAATGACIMVRKADFIKVDMFDELYNWCYEDVDLGLKLTYDLGKSCVVPAAAKLIHKESWSKAKPSHFDAKVRIQAKWADRVKFDVFLYGSLDYNKY